MQLNLFYVPPVTKTFTVMAGTPREFHVEIDVQHKTKRVVGMRVFQAEKG